MPLGENLDHACRRWDAEEEYARKLGTRVQIVSTVTLGFLGVVSVQALRAGLAGKALHHGVWWSPYVVMTLTGVGLLLLLWACGKLFDVLRRRSGGYAHSSGHLVIPEDIRDALEIELLDTLTDPGQSEEQRRQAADLYRYHAAWTFDRAADNLNSRNRAENERIRQAQTFLLAGLICIVLGLMGWVYTSAKGMIDEPRTARETLEGRGGDPGDRWAGSDRRPETPTSAGLAGSDQEAQPDRTPASGEAR